MIERQAQRTGGTYKMGNTVGAGASSTVYFRIDTCKAHGQLAKDTRDGICLWVVCELFCV